MHDELWVNADRAAAELRELVDRAEQIAKDLDALVRTASRERRHLTSLTDLAQGVAGALDRHDRH